MVASLLFIILTENFDNIGYFHNRDRVEMPIIRRFEYPDTWDSNRSESQIHGSGYSRVSRFYGSKFRFLRIQDSDHTVPEPDRTDPRFINYESEIHILKMTHVKIVLISKIFNWIIKIEKNNNQWNNIIKIIINVGK